MSVRADRVGWSLLNLSGEDEDLTQSCGGGRRERGEGNVEEMKGTGDSEKRVAREATKNSSLWLLAIPYSLIPVCSRTAAISSSRNSCAAGVDAWLLAFAGTGDVEGSHAVLVEPLPGIENVIPPAVEQVDHVQWPGDPPGEFDGERGATLDGAGGDHQGGVRVPDIPAGADIVQGAVGFPEGIVEGQGAVFRLATLRAPAAAGNACCDGDIEGGPVDASLASRDDPLQDGIPPMARGGSPGSLAHSATSWPNASRIC